MKWVWTWSGKYFGYIDGKDLWTHDGKHVGKLSGNEIYGPDGSYLGEVMNKNRLITNHAKKSLRGPVFVPAERRDGYGGSEDDNCYPVYRGHEDFPSSERF